MASPRSQDPRAGPIRYGPSDPIAARLHAERERRLLIALGAGAALVLGALFLREVRAEDARQRAAALSRAKRAKEEAARSAAERHKKGLGPDVRDMDVGEVEKYLRGGKP